MTNHILIQKKEYKNVIILYPFNFNSTYRSKDFLFGKIFSSIINKEKIEIGNTYFHRDIVHTKFVVNESLNAKEDKIIGSGRLTFVNDFIRDLFKYFKMDYNFYIEENLLKFKERPVEKEFYLDSKKNLFTYDELLTETILELENQINTKINKK
jgi:GDP-D-mannose dehydratase